MTPLTRKGLRDPTDLDGDYLRLTAGWRRDHGFQGGGGHDAGMADAHGLDGITSLDSKR